MKLPTKPIKYKKGYKGQLDENYEIKIPIKGHHFENSWYTLHIDGTLFIKRGYAWDFASGPVLQTRLISRATMIHDVLYQAIGKKHIPTFLRKTADDIFYEILKHDLNQGIYPLRQLRKIRGFYFWRAVVRFGPKKGSKPKKVYQCP